jgi:hypothetical protein
MLHGFDGDTGNIVFAGGGTNELLAGTRHFMTAIAARGRIYVGTDNRIYSLTSPGPFTNSAALRATAAGTNLTIAYSMSTPQGRVTLVRGPTLQGLRTNPQPVSFVTVPSSMQGQFQVPFDQTTSAQFYRLLLAPISNMPPTVQLTKPAPGSTVSAVVDVSAAAAAPVGTPAVQFYMDGVPLGTSVFAPPFTTSWDTELAAAGTHILTALATTQAGVSNTSVPVSVTLDNSHPANPIGIDVTVFRDGTASPVQTPPFSCSTASELLVAFVAFDGPTVGTQTATVTGAGLNWQLAARSDAQNGTAEIWVAKTANTLSGALVTAQPGLTGNYHGTLVVVAFTNASGVGIVGNASAASGAPNTSLPGVSAGNWVFAVGNDWDGAVARTPAGGQVLVHQWVDNAVGDTFWVQSTATPSVTNGPVNINDTAPTGDRWNYAAAEVVATKQ